MKQKNNKSINNNTSDTKVEFPDFSVANSIEAIFDVFYNFLKQQ
jgi:hypothetical protein